jgi:hypothetical protein
MLVAQDEVRCARTLYSFYAHRVSTFPGRSGAPQRGLPCVMPCSPILWDHAETFCHFFQVVVVHGVDQRVGDGHADVAYDLANVPTYVPAYMYNYFRNRQNNGASDYNWTMMTITRHIEFKNWINREW